MRSESSTCDLTNSTSSTFCFESLSGYTVCQWYLHQGHGWSYDGVQPPIQTVSNQHLVLFGLVQSWALDLKVLSAPDQHEIHGLLACRRQQKHRTVADMR